MRKFTTEKRPCPQCSGRTHSQNELHGKGIRVHNVVIDENKRISRCTVCGQETVTIQGSGFFKDEKTAEAGSRKRA
jgi:transposase